MTEKSELRRLLLDAGLNPMAFKSFANSATKRGTSACDLMIETLHVVARDNLTIAVLDLPKKRARPVPEAARGGGGRGPRMTASSADANDV